MSELAFNLNGEAFNVPQNAAGWRVRRMKAKGAPEVVYGRNGQPLVLPLEADLDDVRSEVASPGRYRFDPIDDANKPIEGAPAGYVFVHEVGAAVAHSVGLGAPSDSIVIEAMRMNAEIARSVVDKFPQMLEAAAVLLRAADGAGLPARPPMAVANDADDEEDDDDTDDDDDDSDRPAGFDVNALLAQLVPMLMAGLASGKLKLPGLAAMLDWRKAKPTSTSSPRLEPMPVT